MSVFATSKVSLSQTKVAQTPAVAVRPDQEPSELQRIQEKFQSLAIEARASREATAKLLSKKKRTKKPSKTAADVIQEYVQRSQEALKLSQANTRLRLAQEKLQQQTSGFEVEKRRLVSELAEKEIQARAAVQAEREKAQQMQKRVTGLEERTTTLDAQIAQETKRLAASRRLVTEQNERLQNLRGIIDARNAAHSVQLREAEMALNETQAKAESAQRELDEKLSQLREIQAELKSQKEETARLSLRVKGLQEDKEGLEARLTALNQKLIRAQEDNAKSLGERQNLESQRDAALRKIENLVAASDRTLREKDAALLRVQEESHKATEAQARAEQERRRAEIAQALADEQQARAETAERAAQDALDRADTDQESARLQIQQAQREAETALNQAQEATHRAEVEAQRADSAQVLAREETQRAADLAAALTVSQTTLTARDAENEQLRVRVAELEAMFAKSQQDQSLLENDRSALMRTVATLGLELETVKENLEDAKFESDNNAAASKEALAFAQTQLLIARGGIELSEKKAVALSAERDNVVRQRDDFKDKLNKTEDNITALSSEAVRLREQVDLQKQQNAELENTLSRANKEAAQAEAASIIQRTSLQELQQALDDSRGREGDARSRSGEIHDELLAAKEEAERLKSLLVKRNDLLYDLENKNLELAGDISEQTVSNRALKQKQEEAEHQLREAKQKEENAETRRLTEINQQLQSVYAYFTTQFKDRVANWNVEDVDLFSGTYTTSTLLGHIAAIRVAAALGNETVKSPLIPNPNNLRNALNFFVRDATLGSTVELSNKAKLLNDKYYAEYAAMYEQGKKTVDAKKQLLEDAAMKTIYTEVIMDAKKLIEDANKLDEDTKKTEASKSFFSKIASFFPAPSSESLYDDDDE